jgi:hypothetical protein
MGYNKYAECLSFLQASEKNWKTARIFLFDAPKATDMPYFQRLELLKQST